MNFNRVLIFTGLFMALFSVACYSKKQPSPKENTGFAVVELFTSEGCSSCPSAEAALAEVHNEYKQHVYVMEFHVDYWNYIGWKDLYSNSEYTKRQQQYASKFQLGSTYTPQAIINGRNELVGSEKVKLHALIDDNLQKQPLNTIGLNALVNGNNVLVKYSVTNTKEQVLNIALVQKQAETNVRKGENSGRKLKHINIVRELKTVDAKDQGSLDITIPQGLTANDCTIIAYTQDKDSWQVTGAAEEGIK